MVRRHRRFWIDEEKRRIVAQTRSPGVSVSVVARRYDVNANLVFKWLRDPRYTPAADEAERYLGNHAAAGVGLRQPMRRSISGISSLGVATSAISKMT